jgi:succinate dehydrogenase / fumarate reductase cytochrome b subunit
MSPHVQVWKWHVTMATSIFHRVTGVGNYVGIFIAVAWLFALGAGPDYYEPLAAVTGSIWGQLVLFAFTLSVCFHILSGVRHLFWDTGRGFNPKQASFIGGVIIVLSVVLAVAAWLLLGLVPGVDPLRLTGAAL